MKNGCLRMAGVRAAGEGKNNGAPAPGTPGRAVRDRRACRSHRRRRPRSHAVVLARQKPAWEPGTRQAYHALTLGFYEGELLRRVDPHHRSLGQFFQDEIASPLRLDVYIRLPEEIPNSRLATIAPPGRLAMLIGFPLRLTLEAMNRRSNIYRALDINRGARVYFDAHRIYARHRAVPYGTA